MLFVCVHRREEVGGRRWEGGGGREEVGGEEVGGEGYGNNIRIAGKLSREKTFANW